MQVGESLQKLGFEFGVTTGRPRRCGWLDLHQLKYADDINHFTAFAMTKLDVMDTFEEIKVCVGYSCDDNNVTVMPASVQMLAQCKPVYKTFPGWKTDTTKCLTVRFNSILRLLTF